MPGASYQPASRRPIADLFRRTAHAAVRVAVRARIHPDVFSYGSIVSAALAAYCFWRSRETPVLLLAAIAFALLRLWLNMFDGMVALAAGKASKRGEIVNDLPDRASDVLIFAGVAHSGWCNPFVAYWVAILSVIVAYVGLFGQAVGVQREFSGVMAKPWRIVMLSLGALATYIAVRTGRGVVYGGWTIIDWANFGILAGCAQTIWVRLSRIFRALNRNAG
jgi:phosphatidylglycerophosphate synthase